VYQRGRSRPARARLTEAARALSSVSKRPFPTSQSVALRQFGFHLECIKEAVPDQPEPDAFGIGGNDRVYQRGRSRPARARWRHPVWCTQSVSKRPFPTSQSWPVLNKRKGASVSKRPFPTSQSAAATLSACTPSVSKRPFPTSQSEIVRRATAQQECIKEAVPDQPERDA